MLRYYLLLFLIIGFLLGFGLGFRGLCPISSKCLIEAKNLSVFSVGILILECCEEDFNKHPDYNVQALKTCFG